MKKGWGSLGRRLALGLGGAFALCAPGCDGNAGRKGEGIAIGFMVYQDDVAQAQADTVRLLVSLREINDQGGVQIDGVDHPLTLVTEDHGGAPAGAVAAMERFADQGVTAVVGPPWSSLTLGDSGDGSDAAIAAAKDLGILLVSASATAPAISQVDDDDLFFRTVPSDAFQGGLAASLLYEEGTRSIAVLHRDDAWGQGLSNAFVENYEELGGSIVANVAYDVSEGSLDALLTRSYSSELDSVFEDQPEAIYLLNFDEFTAVSAAIVSGGYLDSYPEDRPIIFVSDSVFDENTLANVPPKFLSRLRGTSQIPDPENENFAAYAALMEDEGLSPPEIYDAARHDAVFLIALAMQKSESTSAHEMKQELRSLSSEEAGDTRVSFGQWEKAKEALLEGEGIDYDGPSGPIDFSPEGDPSTGTFVIWSITGEEDAPEFEILDTVTYSSDR